MAKPWTPPADEEIQDTGWTPPADEALDHSPSMSDIAYQAAKTAITGPYDATKYALDNPDAVRQQLPTAGAVMGEIVAGPPGAAIGAGLGQIGSRMAGIAYGTEPPSQGPLREAIGPMIQSAAAGLPGTTEGQAVTNYIGKGIRKVQAAFSGAKPEDLARATQKGYSVYTAPSMEEASQNFGQALEKSGIKTTPTLESTLDPQLTQARETALAAGKKLDLHNLPVVPPGSKTGDPHALFAYHDNFGQGGTQREIYNVFGDPAHPSIAKRGFGSSVPKEELDKLGIPITGKQPNAVALSPTDALKGRQAVDRIIASTPQKDKPTLLALGQLRDKFNQVLSSLSPETSAASKVYADATLKRNLLKIIPVNKSGEYSKLAPYLAAATGSAVGYGHHNSVEGALAAGSYLLGTSPLAMGAIATTAGMISPVVRQAIVSEFINRLVVGKKGSSQ